MLRRARPTRTKFLLVIACLSVNTLVAADFYVSPTGTPSGNGSLSSPWDLTTALNHPPAVLPGDTIWLRGGVYNAAAAGRSAYRSKLIGAPNQPIIVRQYPGERAVIDAIDSGPLTPGLRVDGPWTWFWGFEITNSYPTRSLNEARNHGIEVYAANTKLINLIIHDTGQGIGFWTSAVDSEVNGNIIFNNGWLGQDRGHGHGIYTQNATGFKTIRNNFLLSEYGYNLQAYGTNALVHNYIIDDNTIFDGTALVGGQQGAANITFRNNNIYRGGAEIGRDIDSDGSLFLDNYIAG